MSQFKQPPDPPAPEVIVRAGKTFVCLACGTLVEIPAEYVGQMVTVPAASAEAARPKPVAPQPVATPEKPSSETSAQGKPTAADAASANTTRKKPSPAQAARRRPNYINHIIDGLVVPSGRQLDRAVAWVCFRLKTLERQDDEIRQLKRLLRKLQRQKQPVTRLHTPSAKLDGNTISTCNHTCVPTEHAKASVPTQNLSESPTTEKHNQKHQERGPP